MNIKIYATLKEFIKHLCFWFRQFPSPLDDDVHTFSGTFGNPIMTCFVCGRIMIDQVDESKTSDIRKELKEILEDMVKDDRDFSPYVGD